MPATFDVSGPNVPTSAIFLHFPSRKTANFRLVCHLTVIYDATILKIKIEFFPEIALVKRWEVDFSSGLYFKRGFTSIW